jgi:hypothetical protein
MALTKTTSIVEIDAWAAITAATAREGAAHDVSASYNSLLYIEVALGEAVAHAGYTVFVEVSYADDDWVQLTSFSGTIETAATTTINDAAANAGDTTITLTDAATGDFDMVGRKWFILEGTVGNSESVRTKSQAANVVTLFQDMMRSHTNGANVYDRVDEWCIEIPFAASQVRVLIDNTDADCDIYSTTRISKVTALI